MEWTEYLRFLLALLFVLGLIGIIAWLAKRAGLGGATARRRPDGSKRLSLEEVLVLDARRRVALIRRDGVEHLLLLGVDGDRVIETGIAPVPAAPMPAKGPRS
jgi:flagellar protein FliO/FliZ